MYCTWVQVWYNKNNNKILWHHTVNILMGKFDSYISLCKNAQKAFPRDLDLEITQSISLDLLSLTQSSLSIYQEVIDRSKHSRCWLKMYCSAACLVFLLKTEVQSQHFATFSSSPLQHSYLYRFLKKVIGGEQGFDFPTRSLRQQTKVWNQRETRTSRMAGSLPSLSKSHIVASRIWRRHTFHLVNRRILQLRHCILDTLHSFQDSFYFFRE